MIVSLYGMFMQRLMVIGSQRPWWARGSPTPPFRAVEECKAAVTVTTPDRNALIIIVRNISSLLFRNRHTPGIILTTNDGTCRYLGSTTTTMKVKVISEGADNEGEGGGEWWWSRWQTRSWSSTSGSINQCKQLWQSYERLDDGGLVEQEEREIMEKPHWAASSKANRKAGFLGTFPDSSCRVHMLLYKEDRKGVSVFPVCVKVSTLWSWKFRGEI